MDEIDEKLEKIGEGLRKLEEIERSRRPTEGESIESGAEALIDDDAIYRILPDPKLDSARQIAAVVLRGVTDVDVPGGGGI